MSNRGGVGEEESEGEAGGGNEMGERPYRVLRENDVCPGECGQQYVDKMVLYAPS